MSTSVTAPTSSEGYYSRFKGRGGEHPRITRHVLGLAALAAVLNDAAASPASITAETHETLAEINAAFTRERLASEEHERRTGIPGGTYLDPSFLRAVPAGVGEVFGYQLAQAAAMQEAGLNVPEVRLSDEPLGAGWFSKPISGGSGFCNSRRVARSLPIFYLGGDNAPPVVARWDAMLHKMTDTAPVAREYYDDFPAEFVGDERVLSLAKINSPARLVHFAFSAFLYRSYPHGSNALVEAPADFSAILQQQTGNPVSQSPKASGPRLWLIDHEKIMYPRDPIGDDIEATWEMVKHYPAALAVCRQIGKITGQEIEQALAGVPARFWQSRAAFNTPRDAADYFKRRLHRWRVTFGGEAVQVQTAKPL